MTTHPDLARRNARSRLRSTLQRYVVIASDGAAITTHRALKVARERLVREPAGKVWDRFDYRWVVPEVTKPGRTAWARLDEDNIADDLSPDATSERSRHLRAALLALVDLAGLRVTVVVEELQLILQYALHQDRLANGSADHRSTVAPRPAV